MKKFNIRAPAWLKVIGAILLIVSVFGLAFQLFRIPDTDIGSENGSGSTVAVPDADDTEQNKKLPFDGTIPDYVEKIEGEVVGYYGPEYHGSQSCRETDTGWEITSTSEESSLTFIHANNNSDLPNTSYLTIDFDLTFIDFLEDVSFALNFWYQPEDYFSWNQTLSFSPSSIYLRNSGADIEEICIRESDTFHLTFVYASELYRIVGDSFPVKYSVIFCYIDGIYLGEILGYSPFHDSDSDCFNGLSVIFEESTNYGTKIAVDNLEIYSYENTYEPKNIDTVLENKESLYSCEDWCYYKKENE